jgi:pilus assembly protein Flp/PilA
MSGIHGLHLMALVLDTTTRVRNMNRVTNIANRFHQDESGAAMVEYTVLLGIITVAVIAIIVGVGGWVTGRWTGLCGNLNTSGVGTCVSGKGT